MNDATFATYDVHNPITPLDSNEGRTGQRTRNHSAGSTLYPIDTTDGPENQSFSEAYADRQVREDKGFYIPDFLSETGYDAKPDADTAFAQQVKHLHKAEGLVDDAWNLTRLMLASLGDEGDSRAMQIEAGLKVIGKKLRRAHAQIDKHDTRYTNLFLAYFDLRDKTDGGERD